MKIDPYIDFQSVTKSFQGSNNRDDGAASLQAIEKFSIQVSRGEFVVILGPSGCGKSTILNLLAGFDRPSSGKVLCSGQQISGPSHERGVVFQEDTLFPWLTVRQNILFGPRCRNSQQLPNMDETLGLIGLQGFENSFPRELSGGMKQRVALARVLVNEPEVLLMDEPFGALDAQTREEVQDLLATVHARLKPTIVFITHDVEEAVYLADRVLVLSERPGRLIADIPIQLDRPRSQSDREAMIFTQLKAGLRRLLRNNDK
ncbi:ABC transporter ATP-binding protein [Oryzomonas japonica]|uniref:ABC transporter ATP-binding protein n=1 Tax=Oryzomonas japonica TaxID=2603858 RepID=A0A7J4ZW14_9BACT|nr:ABC transporter ATP-binding protein [Oryzomonas japonica]KAB0667710.1 ABC transporter ATP-binding protein [Oryzomonas japonica]